MLFFLVTEDRGNLLYILNLNVSAILGRIPLLNFWVTSDEVAMYKLPRKMAISETLKDDDRFLFQCMSF